ncbi:MAG TPA: enoyl-CoA hydratase/isomerase family protein [Acidimicrobiales bacterium]|nr:enoyl-CoA hydratase/isomerase family protein [Acidimicrobiales bacterium]
MTSMSAGTTGSRRFVTIRCEFDGPVAVITLNRPEKLNAMNPKMAAELHHAFGGLPDGTRAVVVTGDERAFSAGADLAASDEVEEAGAGWIDMLERLARLPQPSIAAIEGYCLGGGLLLALACDLRIAGATAQLGFPEIKRGFFPGTGASQRLIRAVSRSRAKEIMFFGRHVDAAAAERWDLLNRVVEPGEALTTARAWADELAAGPPLALAAIKRLVDEGAELPFQDGLALEREVDKTLGEDANEGVLAFLEKRPPRFQGR